MSNKSVNFDVHQVQPPSGLWKPALELWRREFNKRKRNGASDEVARSAADRAVAIKYGERRS
jgi:hypothetical protein